MKKEAKSRSAAVTRERELEKEIRQARKDREKAGLDITKAQEQARQATTDKALGNAITRRDKAEERMVKAEENINQNEQERYRLQFERETQFGAARISNEAREKLARTQGEIELKLIRERATLEEKVKNNTASPEDRLGLQLLNAIDAHRAKPTAKTKKLMDELFEQYEKFKQAGYRPSTGDDKPIDTSTARGTGGQTGRTPAGTPYEEIL